MRNCFIIGMLLLAMAMSAFALSGTYYIGGTNPGANWYSSFSSAISALNSSGSTGSGVIFNVRPGTYSTAVTSETFPLSITTTTGSASTPILFQRDPANSGTVTISCGTTSGTNFPIVLLFGADYVTFDGIDITATSSTPLAGYCLDDVSTSNGAQHNTIRNCTVTMNRLGLEAVGLLSYTNSTGLFANGGTNSYNTVQNVTVHNAQIGIDFDGDVQGGSVHDTSNFVINCSIGVGVANDIQGTTEGSFGICAEAQYDFVVRGNEIANVTSTSTAGAGYVGDDDAIGIFTFDITGTCLIEQNKIYNIRHAGGTTVRRSAIGIYVDGETLVRNNMIWGLSHTYAGTAVQSITGGRSTGTDFDPGYGVFGIVMRDAATGGWVKTTHNSIALNTNTRLSSTCIYVGRGADTLRNNICVNATAAQTTAKHFGMFLAGGATPSIDYDVLYTPNTNGFIADTSSANGNTLTDMSWASWQQRAHDTHGYNADPMFTTATNLHILANSGSPVSNSGITGWTTVDYDGETRSSTPDIGADEGSFGTTLAAPATLTFGTVSVTSIVVNWSTVASATGYKLESSTNGTNFTQLASPVSGTTYTDTSIPTGNSRRYYRVYSLNSENVPSLSSSPVKDTVSLANTPSAPVVSDVATYSAVIAPQNAASPLNQEATEYAIRVDSQYLQANGTLSSSPVWTTLSSWGATIAVNLTANTTYSVTCMARNANGLTTSWSSATSFTTLSLPPSTISFGTITPTTIQINWTEVPGCTYMLEYSNDDVEYFLLRDGLTTTTFTDSGFTMGNTERDYRIYTRNSEGVLSSAGPWRHTTTSANTPLSPTVSNPTASSFEVTPRNATTPVNTDGTQYAIKVGSLYAHPDGSLDDSPNWETLAVWGTLTVTNLSPSTTYSVSTVARTEFNVQSSYSTISQIVTLALALPPAPQNPAIHNRTASSLHVSWSAPDSPGTLSSYELQFSTTSDSSGFAILETDLPLSPTGYSHVSLNSYTRYWYRIYSKNSQGSLSEQYASATEITRANWHTTNTVVGGSGDTTQWIPQFPPDSLTQNFPAIGIDFQAVSGTSSNPSEVVFRWNHRSPAISDWGLNQTELNLYLPATECVDRFWDINATDGFAFNAILTLRFAASDIPVTITDPVTQITRAGYKHGSANWSFKPCVVTGPDINGLYTATVSGVNQFSIWTLGTETALMPVTLQSFTASNDNLGVVLNWRTETEVNVDRYRIDRWRVGHPVEKSYFVPSLSDNGSSATALNYVWHEPDQLVEGNDYTYQLVEIDLDGNVAVLATSTVTILPTGINLIGAYPNPFNSTIRISVSLSVFEQARVAIYNIQGEKVSEIFDGKIGRIKQMISFNAKELSSGVYFIRVESNHYRGSRKILLVK
ncbi:MAG: fibronectin type III domain-containing protein [bacterium]|nr:fibronectin type III domain-containing protein [bacterium]